MFFKKLVAPLTKLRESLKKTRNRLGKAVRMVLSIGRKIDDELLEELEEALISADLGVEVSTEIVEKMEDAYKMRDIRDQEEIMQFLQKEIARELHSNEPGIPEPDGAPVVLLIVGVNGSGKTTTVAKLARILKQNRKKVLLGACDTFRAAATEQLTIWSERVGVPIVRHQEGADPGAVAYDACEAAMARNADYLIIDTAGRLHTKSNLMKELEKIGRVIEKKMPGAKRETLIVLDGTTGMNALQQAKLFNKSIPLDGVIITKLDGTAKGGIAVAVRRELGVPIKFIGIGEGMDDMHPFDPEDFARALFS